MPRHPPTTAQRAAERVSVASPYYDQLELWYERHRREWVAGMNQQEVDDAREDADVEPSSDGYVVDEGLVDELMRTYPKLTREKAIRLVEEAGW